MIKAGAKDWKNANGSGPYMLTDYVQGSAATFTRNPVYWGEETIGGQSYKLPFADKIVYRFIKDEATYLTALRTAKLDVLEGIRWSAVDELKKSAPALKWMRDLDSPGLLPRAADRPEAVRRRPRAPCAEHGRSTSRRSSSRSTTATPSSSPIRCIRPGSATSSRSTQMPRAAQELFEYNPEKAKALLAEAGYPKGFSFKAQVCSCSPDQMDLLPLLVAYFEKVGVKVEFQPMEYGAFLSAMTTRTHAAGYLMYSGHGNPTTSLRKNFLSKQTFNVSIYSDPAFDTKMELAHLERDEGKRRSTDQGDDARHRRAGALRLAADALQLHGLVAVGQELRRRASRGRRAPRSDPRADVGRPGDEGKDGVLRGC